MRTALALLAILSAAPAFAEGGFNRAASDSFGRPGFSQYASSASAPSNMTTPVFATSGALTSGTATWYTPPVASSTNPTTSGVTSRQVPIPIAGTVKALYGNGNVSQTGSILTAMENNIAGSVACTFSGTTCIYGGTGDSIVAGTTLMWRWTIGGAAAWAQTLPSQISFLFTASGGQQGFLLSAPSNTGVVGSAVSSFNGFGASYTGGANLANETLNSSLMPVAGTLTGLYVFPNGTENATPHVYTIFKNGSASALTCTAAASSSVGCCVNPTGSGTIGGVGSCTTATSVSIAAGDTISIQYGCANGASVPCAGVSPGVSVSWVPSVANQAPLTAQVAGGGQPRWVGLDDNGLFSTNTNYQTTANLGSTLTLSNYITCVNVAPTSGAWITNVNYATSAATAPTTATGITDSLTGSVACPGANSNGYFGAEDTTHTFAASAGYNLVNAITVSGSPSAEGAFKFGIAATVP